MTEQMNVCKNCGNTFSGIFCNNCGEKKYSEKDKTLKSLWKEATHFLTHFDGNFFTSIKAVYGKPGKLSRDFCDGIRKKYFKPISLFLICIVLYLLFPRFQGLNMKFSTYVNREYSYSWYALPVAKTKVKSHTITGDQLSKFYDAKSPKFAKPMLLLLLPLSALALTLLHINKRKPFFDHFILATELNVFMVSFTFLVIPFLSWLLQLISISTLSWFHDGGPIQISGLIISLVMTILAIKRFYGEKWWIVLIKGILFTVLFNLVIQEIYKVILYLAVMLFI